MSKTENKQSKLKKLGEGSFGCVVSQPLKCSDKEKMITGKKQIEPNQVGKLFYDKNDYQDEVRLSKLVRKIDPSETKLLVPTSACAVSKHTLEKPENVNAIMKCEKITNKDTEYQYYENTNRSTIPDKVWQLKMPYAGVDIDKALDEYKNRIAVKSFMKMMIPVFEGLVLLKEHRLVHQDIKLSNILVYKKKARIIDFSLMLPFKEIYTMTNYYRLKRKYRPFPPEYYLTSLVMKYESELNGQEQLSIMKKTLGEKYEHHIEKIAHYFEPFYTLDELHSHVEYKSLLTSIIKNIDIMRNYVDKIDIYSVGTVMSELCKYQVKQPLTNSRFVEFMRGILHPDPRLRTSVEDALNQCKLLSQ